MLLATNYGGLQAAKSWLVYNIVLLQKRRCYATAKVWHRSQLSTNHMVDLTISVMISCLHCFKSQKTRKSLVTTLTTEYLQTTSLSLLWPGGSGRRGRGNE